MKLLAVLIALLALGCQTPSTPDVTREAPTPSPAPTDEPERDYTALRTQYGDRLDFIELCEKDRPLEELFGLANDEKWSEVLAIAEPWLAKCPVDIDARLVSAVAFAEQGQDDRAREQFDWHEGLVRSILASGDGRSAKTAFVVISVPEEYALLRALGLEGQDQTLVAGRIDKLTVKDEQSRTFSVFFDPAAHFRRLDHLFAPRP